MNESVLIGIDHGYAAMKTAHCSFPTGLERFDHKPFSEDHLLEYDGKFYLVGNHRQPLRKDKTSDDNCFLMTLAAIAMELEYRKAPATASIILSAGLPLTSFGRERKSFFTYLCRGNHPISFRWAGKPYSITILNVVLFPQGYAAALTQPDLLREPSVILADIGGWTVDLMRLDNRLPDVSTCRSLEWMVLIRFFIPNGKAIWNAPGILPGGAADAARKDVQFQSLQTVWFAAAALLWQLLLNAFNSNYEIGIHSADFGVPQVRKRVFLMGYLDPRCSGKVFPLFGSGGKALIQMLPGPQGSRVYDSSGVACTQTAGAGGKGGKTGLYFIDLSTVEPRVTDQARCITAHYAKGPVSNRRGEHSGVLCIRSDTKQGYTEASPGDSVNLGFAKVLRRGRVGHGIAHTLDTGPHQGVVLRSGRIRKLMPRECFRLQGFTDEQIDKVLAFTSDSQAYKQAGNGVTVNVIEAIGRRVREMDAALKAGMDS